MADAATLISYQGNPILGGANAAIGNDNLAELNKTTNQLQILDRNQQAQLFQQKVQDRDTLRNMFQQGIIPSGDIDENDKEVYDQAEKKTIDSFQKIKNLNDKNAIQDFYKNATQLNDVVLHAQTRNAMLKTLESAKANATLPEDQQSIQDFIDNQKKKSFWEQVDPYQKTATLDVDRINKYGSFTTTPDKISEDGLYTTTGGTKFDWGSTLRNANSDYLTPQGRFNQIQLANKVMALPQDQRDSSIAAANRQIDLYNTQLGFKKGQEGFVDQINYQNGQVAELPSDFAAKWALAQQKDYLGEGKQVFNDKLGRYNVDVEKASTDAFYKRAMANAANKKANAYAANIGQQMSLRKDAQEQDAFANDLWKRNLLQQPSLIQGGKGNLVGFKNIDATSSLPLFTFDGSNIVQLKPIGGKPSIGTNGKIVYTGGHYEPQYMLNGKAINPKQTLDIYQKFKKVQGSDWNGSFDDFLKQAIDAGKFKVAIKGSNGVTDEDLSRAAMQAISNKNTKKGQQAVFDSQDNNPPADDATVPDNSTDNSQQ